MIRRASALSRILSKKPREGAAMSGSGGSGGGGSRPDEGLVDCESLIFEAVVSSVQPDALAALLVGEILRVVLESPQGTRMIALRREAEDLLVGTLTTGSVTQLLRCIQQGVEFVAEVLSIEEGIIRVRIHAQT
jgi:hypothetical protein